MVACLIEGCERARSGRSTLCGMHYQRLRKHGDAGEAAPRKAQSGRTPCEVCGDDSVGRRLCAKHYYRLRKHGDPLLGRSKRPDGAGHIDRNGYVVKQVNGVTDLEHRQVMALILGRPLLPTESVHHKNGDRADNRPENLELWSKAQPAGQRVDDKVAFAMEILALYAPHLLSSEAVA